MSDILLANARLSDHDGLVDIAVADGTISAVHPAGVGPRAGQRLDLDGRWVLPGLWDAHIHATQWVTAGRRLDLAAAKSASEALHIAAGRLAGRDPARALIGYGFRDALWPDAPTLEAIDRVAGERVVVLVSGDLHCGWVSSAAARVLGVDVDPSGVVREAAWFAVHARLDDLDPLTSDDFRRATAAAARRGVVGVVDFENDDNIAAWPARVAAGVTSLRVVAGVWPDRVEAAIAAGLRTGDPLDPAGLVRVGPLKVVVDGSLNTRTAWCWDPYPGYAAGAHGACGEVTVPPEQLVALLGRAKSAGIGAAVHAIGDRANTAVLDAFEEVGMTGTVEHAQLVREEEFARFAALGLVASVQPEHAMDDRDVADRHWAGRTGRAFAFGSLLRAGAELRLGSDAPVAPLDPWQAIASAVGRARDGREPWHPEQRIPIDAALRASVRSEIAVGQPADIAVVEADPLGARPEVLRTMPVAATLLAGRPTHLAL
ncbi:amidohydrolase [Microbacterium sp. Marseille-Q6965]|uniref:amidohydrolase n=1 Tax=Microbacterium sp. Marseille-Q6965 TaxID=2965072 RepID=UPI0021B8184D|nr:amidohydrolase family protein [Microbacterium sp. Marseille-Q6965]